MKNSATPPHRRVIHALIFGAGVLALSGNLALALDGSLGVHDPSTIVTCKGQYYLFATGRGIPIMTSPDGFTWQRQGHIFDKIPESVKSVVPKNNGSGVWAPDVIHLNDQYYVYYAVSSWGSFVSAIGLMTNPTLDPKDPAYKWTDGGLIVNSVEGEELNAIDPGVLSAPDGTLWLCYGSYHGNIELVELNPKTGQRIAPKSQVSIIANKSEASDIIFRDGYYYLFVNHGSCCKGKDSTYHIRVGRSKEVRGPYLDREGNDLAKGAGTLFLATSGNQIGPGHFGRLMEDGAEKFSCHYEADLDKGGRSTLGIRPLLWSADGWPMPGEDLKAGTYTLAAKQGGAILEMFAATATRAAPAGSPPQWTLAPAAGGLYTITSTENGMALEFTPPIAKGQAPNAIILAPSSGADNQLWKIDQLPDGSYRIACKNGKLALTATQAGGQPPAFSAEPFSGAANQRWVAAAR